METEIKSENGRLSYKIFAGSGDLHNLEVDKEIIMEFKEINKTNYWDCIALTVEDSQTEFVADNKQSLVEAAYEDGLYVLGIYDKKTMVGFLLYDYDDTLPGWSMSRFMIGKQFQGKGYGKQAVLAFFDYIKNSHNADKLYISVSLENSIARKMYSSIGFTEVKEIEYTFLDKHYREMQMVKEL
ncbi:MAG: GNAT family N-acetyltransferase [Lachnospiraceae bacterium]|nr:GNAT family N-acetyltransferase [Lachnospiraceae bacterium]